ncbi:PTS sugar transporter subunit IIA [Corynebacterium mendelii]|uniref:Ascorbate-specific PTS system EIIA component n=1 Tax=Corynebacterium mendelii TaxID=2765362 RepID=A0A939E371_9CORY|nr:PTS sugar transporter subunit IIA [Corynebacterium mendelii]MBN9644928.1 PTS sugar transporter subunit IIA [Corynebacterium mendelii]
MNFKPDAVAAKREAADFKEAIRIVGSLYEKEGIATSDYAQAMIDAVGEFGPYMVLMPGLAMPHAKSGAGVNRRGCAVVTLSTPVEFGHEKNDPVDVLVSFAAGEKKAHMEMIQSLANALSDAELIEAIRNAETDEELAALFES